MRLRLRAQKDVAMSGIRRNISKPLPPRDKAKDARIQTALLANEIARVAAVGEGLEPTWFDYEAVPAENRGEVLKIASTIKAGRRRLLEDVVEIGSDLLRAKELVGHGNFARWLQFEFSWSERTARRFMELARQLRGKSAKLADLDLATASALVAKSTPAEIRDHFLKRAQAGESVSRAQVVAAVRTHGAPYERPGTESYIGRDTTARTVRIRYSVQDKETPAHTVTRADLHRARVENAANRGREALRELAAVKECCTAGDIVGPLPDEGNKGLPEFLEALASAMRAKRALN